MPSIDEPLAVTRGSNTRFFQADGLGSITSLAGTTGTVSDYYVYDSFGNMTRSHGNFVQPFGFTGRELDSETGLMYYRARYYDPQIGRFINGDPLRYGGGVNFFAYAANAPTNLIDSLGEATQVAIGGPVSNNFFGHASLIINGQVFSYGTDYTGGAPGTRDWGANADIFLNAQSELRATTLLSLNITEEQESTLFQYLRKHNPNAPGAAAYSAFGHSCVTTIESALADAGIETILNPRIPGCAGGECMPLTAATTPAGLETNLFLQTGLVSQTTTVGHQTAGYWSSFWGTVGYALSRGTH